MRIHILASGSSGNALLVDTGETLVLFDAGLSFRELRRRSEEVGVDLSRLKALFISHEHTDHVKGGTLLARHTRCVTWLNRATHEVLRERRGLTNARVEHFSTGEEIPLNGIRVRTFAVSHDSVEPVGFVIEARGTRIGLATDLGHVTPLVSQRLAGCGILVLESNHDVPMLMEGPYHPDLKRRIRSRSGHLSNDQCAELLGELLHPGVSHVVLAHLSEQNNTPALAHQAALGVISAAERPPRLAVASQHHALTISVEHETQEE
jgi:phosphoribosyl 1,2-cyclic phosphodiesterase